MNQPDSEQELSTNGSTANGSEPESSDPTVIAIGASAGGLEALKRFFDAIPAESGLAFVVVMHLSPDYESHLADLLQPHCRIPVVQVSKTMKLVGDQVYVIPPGKNLTAVDTHLRIDELEEKRSERAPIDHFFRTLASSHEGHSIGIILTGTGSDGTLGVKALKAHGAFIIVQDPNDAQYDGMPQNAIATGMADLILPLSDIPPRVITLSQFAPKVAASLAVDEFNESDERLLQKVFAQLRTRTGRDFTYYKRSTIFRRISRRMQLLHIENLESYLDLLRGQPGETQTLADDLLITVTNFFRDEDVFGYLEERILPSLIKNKEPDDYVRVWSVGCATGEEAYSLAILLVEAMTRAEQPVKIQVFASDLHERALTRAREGYYSPDITTDVSAQRLTRFFNKENGGYRVRKEIRELVVFAPHNLLADPPFSRLDLISCRNLLIYLQREIQKDIIELFHYSLNPNSYLVLGTSETVDTSDLFRVESKNHCVYQKRNVPAPEPRLPVFPLTRMDLPGGTDHQQASVAPVPYGVLHAWMVERYAPPSLLLTPEDKVAHLSERAGRYLVHPGGELTSNVFKLVRDELCVELRTVVHAARQSGRLVRSEPIALKIRGEPTHLVIDVRPAADVHQEGFILVIFDEQAMPEPETDADGSSPSESTHQDNGTIQLRSELDMTRQRLQSIIEQYETSQEEMRASNEELQSTNEELRSTMEELETSKEELQSMNEELQTVNQENRHKVEELAQLSSDLQNLLAATHIATLFLDRELQILRFTPKVGELFNIRMADRGRPLADFTHRLGYDAMLDDTKKVLRDLATIEREVQDDAGHWYLTRVLPYRSTEDRIEGVVITFVDVTERKKSEQRLQMSEQRYRLLVESALEYAIFLLDRNGRISLWNRGAQRLYGYSEDEMLGKSVSLLSNDVDRQLGYWDHVLKQAVEKRFIASDNWQRRKDNSQFWGGGVITAIESKPDGEAGFAVVIRDNTERSETEAQLRESETRIRLACEATGFGSYDYHIAERQSIWSPELFKMFGLAENATITPNTMLSFIHPDEVEDFVAHSRHSKATETDGQHDRQFRVIVDGEVRWLRDVGHTFFSGDGENRTAVRVVGMVQDITVEKRYQESLEEARRTAEEANRSRGEFLANMSHEIRTPMTAILGHVDILSEEVDDSRHHEYLSTIRKNGMYLLEIINDILDLSKVDSGMLQVHPETVRLDHFLAEIRSLMNVRAEAKQVDLSIHFDTAVPETIQVDGIRLRQILLNLLSNAIKFTDEGFVRLIVRYIDAQNAMQFDVIDSGIGIDENVREELFEPFRQADNSTTRPHGGTGLGLAICRRLAHVFGGDVSVESTPGKGSKFTLTIRCPPNEAPLIEPELERLHDSTVSATSIQVNANVLVCDDRHDIQFLICRILQRAGATNHTVDNGGQAVQRIERAMQAGESIDLILLDMQMPEVDGYEAARRIRQLGYDRPIIALTANAMQGDRERCLAAGCSDYLTKPIDAQMMLHLLSGLLASD